MFRKNVVMIACALGLLPCTGFAQTIPIPPEFYGSVRFDYEVAIEDLANQMPLPERYPGVSEHLQNTAASEKLGAEYLKLLALARKDGIALPPLLFSESAERITDGLAYHTRQNDDDQFSGFEQNAEYLLQIARLQIEHRPSDEPDASNQLVLASYAANNLGRYETTLRLFREAGVGDAALIGLAKEGRPGALQNYVGANIQSGQTGRGISLLQLALASDELPQSVRRLLRLNLVVRLEDDKRWDDIPEVVDRLLPDLADNPRLQTTVDLMAIQALIESGDLAAAERRAQKGFAADPAGSDYADPLARLFITSGRLDDLREVILKFAPDPDKPPYRFRSSAAVSWTRLGLEMLGADFGSPSDAETIFSLMSTARRAGEDEIFERLGILYAKSPGAKPDFDMEAEFAQDQSPEPYRLRTDRSYFASKALLGKFIEARAAGLPDTITLEALKDRLALALADVSDEEKVASRASLLIGTYLSAAMGDTASAAAFEAAVRAEGRFLPNSKTKECSDAVFVFQDILPGFDEPKWCEGKGEEVEGEYLAQVAVLLETGVDDALRRLQPAMAESATARFNRDSIRMGSNREVSDLRSDRLRRFRIFADLAWLAKQGDATPVTDEQMFEALQWAMLDEGSEAQLQGAAQRIAGARDPELVDLVRRYEALAEIEGRMPQITSISAQETAEEKANRLQRERARELSVDERKAELQSIRETIGVKFPGYFDYIEPRPLTLEDARSRLKPDEAILIVLPSASFVHLFAIDRNSARHIVSPLNRLDVDRRVTRIMWDVGAKVDLPDGVAERWIDDGGAGYPFARGVAYELYQALVEPVGGVLEQKKRVYVSAFGAPASMPFSMLVTERPEGDDADPAALRGTAWLADSFAVVNLPSISSLRLLDNQELAAPQAKLAGFGDPVLMGDPKDRGVEGRMRLRSASAAAEINDLSIPLVERLKKLARLPGTAEELAAIGTALRADAGAIQLRGAATEPAVRNADLSDVSILAFATHGIMPAEIAGLSEAGLVMTPPAAATEHDDGFLGASEIAQLRLTADWVLLSACNTAVGGNSGSRGLTDAFFYAGARSVLASHWPVDDEAAAALTSLAIQARARNPRLSRAEAMQSAMRNVRLNSDHDRKNEQGVLLTWAHPSIWAPFSVFGDVVQ